MLFQAETKCHHSSVTAGTGGSITVLHKLEQETEVIKLKQEKDKLYEENQYLKEELQDIKKLFNHTEVENKEELGRLKTVSSIDDFLCDVTRTRKLDYYSTDHTWGGNLAHQMYCVLLGNPD